MGPERPKAKGVWRMFEGLGAAVLALAGCQVGFPHEAVGREQRALHCCLVTAAAWLVVGLGAVAPQLSRSLAGAGLCLLTFLYLGHAVAVRNWGSPMSQAILMAALQQLPLRASQSPAVLLAIPLGGCVFGLGWAAAWADQQLLGPMALAWSGWGGSLMCLLGAGWLALTHRIPLSSDLLFGVLLGGHGPQGATLPYDPALGERRRATVHPRQRPTVVMFVIDSARAQNFSCYGYPRQTTPRIDQLLEQGACRVPLAISNGVASETGLWAMLASRRVRHQAVNALCLHDILKGAGYSLRLFGSGVHRYYRGLEWLYGNQWDEFRHLLHDPQLVRWAGDLAGPSEQGDFLFFFLMSAHSAGGVEPPAHWTPSSNRCSRRGRGALQAELRVPYLNHYDNGIREADRVIGEVLDALRARGYLSNARVVITADHGEHVFERPQGWWGHGVSLYQEGIHIPLIYWDTRGGCPAPAALVDQTDIAPTLLAELGLQAPASWQGRCLFEHPGRTSTHVEHVHHRQGEPPLHMEAYLCQTSQGLIKLIRHRQRGRELQESCFCLSDDPGERNDLMGRLAPQIHAELRATIDGYAGQPALVPTTTWSYLGLT